MAIWLICTHDPPSNAKSSFLNENSGNLVVDSYLGSVSSMVCEVK